MRTANSEQRIPPLHQILILPIRAVFFFLLFFQFLQIQPFFRLGSPFKTGSSSFAPIGQKRKLRHSKDFAAHVERSGPMSPVDFKELTGLTRKNAIPLLEWLDSKRITRRDGDRRVAR